MLTTALAAQGGFVCGGRTTGGPGSSGAGSTDTSSLQTTLRTAKSMHGKCSKISYVPAIL